MIPSQGSIFQGGAWTPSAYCNIDGVRNEQSGWGMGDIGGMGNIGGVADMDGDRSGGYGWEGVWGI